MKTTPATLPADSQIYNVPVDHHLSLELLGKVHVLERQAVQELRAQADQRERAASQELVIGLQRILRGPCGAEVPKGAALDYDLQARTITVLRPRQAGVATPLPVPSREGEASLPARGTPVP